MNTFEDTYLDEDKNEVLTKNLNKGIEAFLATDPRPEDIKKIIDMLQKANNTSDTQVQEAISILEDKLTNPIATHLQKCKKQYAIIIAAALL